MISLSICLSVLRYAVPLFVLGEEGRGGEGERGSYIKRYYPVAVLFCKAL